MVHTTCYPPYYCVTASFARFRPKRAARPTQNPYVDHNVLPAGPTSREGPQRWPTGAHTGVAKGEQEQEEEEELHFEVETETDEDDDQVRKQQVQQAGQSSSGHQDQQAIDEFDQEICEAIYDNLQARSGETDRNEQGRKKNQAMGVKRIRGTKKRGGKKARLTEIHSILQQGTGSTGRSSNTGSSSHRSGPMVTASSVESFLREL